jgi:hypothetical protein
MATAFNVFEFRKGEVGTINWVIRESQTALAPTIDISTWHLSFKVKRRDRDPDPSLVAGTTTIVDGPNGRAQTVISDTEMAQLFGDYRHALWRTDTGLKTCLSQGYFHVVDTVET